MLFLVYSAYTSLTNYDSYTRSMVHRCDKIQQLFPEALTDSIYFYLTHTSVSVKGNYLK